MNICVFCGSATGHDPVFAQAAEKLGTQIGRHGHSLVYGGGNIGLMGILADAVLKANGKVIGVIPDFLFKKEVAHTGITDLIIVDTMHARKMKMANLADVFIAMAGGWGTLDELAEILTWRQLQLVEKPIGVLNTSDFFSPLLAMMNNMVSNGFLREDNFKQLVYSTDSKELLTSLGVDVQKG
jgi:uncharacterized protein (TIGR00730 family)